MKKRSLVLSMHISYLASRVTNASSFLATILSYDINEEKHFAPFTFSDNLEMEKKIATG